MASATGGVALAQTSSTVITTCVGKIGSVRIVGSAGDCNQNEAPLS
jgi:hypothetical protein